MESQNEFWLMIWAVFFDVTFCVDFYLFLEGSKPWKLSSRLDGSTIFTKSTFSKMGWKMVDLGGILGSSSDTKSIKTCIQEHLFFQHRIFRIFFRFWQHFGRSGRSSMVPSQSLQIPWDPYLQDVGAHCSPGKLPGAILISVWLNLGWFMGCFERILTWFWMDFSNFGSIKRWMHFWMSVLLIVRLCSTQTWWRVWNLSYKKS